jgi:addiction module RelE/StbE family toxin
MVKLVWTKISINDLKEIHDFIAEDSGRYAYITTDKIYSKAQDVSRSPFLGRVVPEINNQNIREIIIGNYRLVYRIVNDEQIDILRVYHSARLLKRESLE